MTPQELLREKNAYKALSDLSTEPLSSGEPGRGALTDAGGQAILVRVWRTADSVAAKVSEARSWCFDSTRAANVSESAVLAHLCHVRGVVEFVASMDVDDMRGVLASRAARWVASEFSGLVLYHCDRCAQGYWG